MFEVILSVLVTQLFFEDTNDETIDGWASRLLHSCLLVYGVSRLDHQLGVKNDYGKLRVLSVIEAVIVKYEKDQNRQQVLAKLVSMFLD